MLGYFTQMSPVTIPIALNLPINITRMPRNMNNGHWIRDIEHGVFTPLVFTPLVFTSTGVIGCEATMFYRRLADLLATHWGQEYSQTINWLRCHFSFALLRCAIMCIHGSRPSAHCPVLGPLDLSVVLAESRLTN